MPSAGTPSFSRTAGNPFLRFPAVDAVMESGMAECKRRHAPTGISSRRGCPRSPFHHRAAKSLNALTLRLRIVRIEGKLCELGGYP